MQLAHGPSKLEKNSDKGLTSPMCSLRSLVSPNKTLQINEGIYFCYSQGKLVQTAQKTKIDRMMYDTIFFTNVGPLNLIVMLFQ